METLLIVDDDLSLLESLKMHFEDIEHDGSAALPGGDGDQRRPGLRVAQERHAQRRHPRHDAPGPHRPGHHRGADGLCGDARIILVTAFHDMESTIRAMKAGAFDYIHKPFPDLAALDIVVSRALEHRQLSRRAAT